MHTPAPWRVEEGTTLIWGNCDPNDRSSYGLGYPVADCQYPRSWRRDRPSDDEIDGNARLIAASPRLYAALKALIPQDFDDHPQDFLDDWKEAREALRQVDEAPDATPDN